jgi:hypothetical protein
MKMNHLHALALTALLAAGACDRVPTDAPGPDAAVPQADDGRKLLGTITCRVDVATQTQKCGDFAPAGGISQTRVIYGGSLFALVVGASWHDSGLQVDNKFIQIQNNLGQDIGTHNGIQSDSIRAFLTNLATTGGTGIVSANNHTGTGTFTASNQPYWEYREIVSAGGGQSSSLIWVFNVPNTVTSYTYTVALSAPIAHPNGWVSVSGDTQIPNGGSRTHTAVVYDWIGNVVTGGYVLWSRTNVSGSVTFTVPNSRQAIFTGTSVGSVEIWAYHGSATEDVNGANVY